MTLGPGTRVSGRKAGGVDRRTFNKLAGLASLVTVTGKAGSAAWAQPAQRESAASGGHDLWSRYFLGAAYYPEWWPEAEWETDFREMQELGINCVRMGEFAWASYEPQPGKFVFDWMDKAIAIARRHGIGVILGTPTASIPPWLYQMHPDVLTGNDIGLFSYGGRKGYNTSSPNYLDACARIVAALAEHYGPNAGVIGWQLDNEPGYPPQAYDPVTERAFQNWLQKHYGSLEKLNEEWNGAFWSNTFSDWSQIRIPRNSAEGGWQPAISLAYRRFYSDSFLNHLRRQAAILRRSIRNQFLFTNWPAPTWSVDVFEAASEFLDATAWDNYVSAPGLGKFQRQYLAGFHSDFCRCAGPHQHFLCAEQNAYVPPNAMNEGLRLQAFTDLAHGARGQIFFEWRRPVKGGEEHRPSFIKGFDGEINPAKDRLAQIGREMARIGPHLAKATTRADIAILYDFSNEWAQGYGGIGDKNPRYNGEAQIFYSGFKTLQRNIDIVPMKAYYSGYKVIIASNLRLIDDGTIARLRAFVSGGGTLVLNYKAATQDMENGMRRTLAPGAFADIAGVRSVAMLDLTEVITQPDEFSITFSGNNTAFHPRTTIESLVLHGAEPIAFVHGGLMEGKPAVTRNRHGQGWVFYVGVDCVEDAFYETVARKIAETCRLTPLVAAPYGVEVTSRQDADRTYYFFLNLLTEDQGRIDLPHPMDDLINGKSGVTQIALGPLEVALLASK